MFTSYRTIMAPVDCDDMFKLTKEVIRLGKMSSTDDEVNALSNYFDFQHATEELVKFICEHDIEFLDLLSRGRSDTTTREYTRDDNGRTIPYYKEE